MNISKKKVQLITGLVNTLLGTNISHEKSILNLEDDFPFPQVGYVNFLEGIGLHRDKSQDFVPQRWKGFVFRSKPGLHPMRRGEQKKRRNLQCQMEGWDCWWSAWNILKSLKSSLQAWFALSIGVPNFENMAAASYSLCRLLSDHICWYVIVSQRSFHMPS